MFFNTRTLSKMVIASVATVLFAVTSLATTSLHAQSSTAGAISGTVTDTSGALLPAAVIVVTSVDTGEERKAKANANGEFKVEDLTPGTYKATITIDGFETFVENGITVTVGGVASVTPKLKVGSVSDKVEVGDTTPLMHTQDAAISTTIDQNTIDNLPINGRRWSDFARLTPGVVSNAQGFGLLSFRGISFLLNNNTVDGADDNQAYYSEARGRTRTAYTITPAAIQEFQVNTSNYSAQYGRSAGGVINTVTKSGGNQYHGEIFFYDRDVNLGGAANPYTLLSVPNAAGVYQDTPVKPTDWRKEWGFGIGGPIIHDKLFWFYAYDQERRNFPGISRPTDTNDVFAPARSVLNPGETCNTSSAVSAYTDTNLDLYTEGDYNACEISDLYGVSYEAGAAYYTQGLGIVNSLIGYVPRRQDQVINLPKLDYQINDRNHLSLLYNRMRYSSPNGLYSQASDVQGRSGWGNDNVKEDFGIFRLATVVNNSMVNDFLAQYGRDFEFDHQNGPVPNEIPLANNTFGAAAGTNIGYETSGGFYAGANPNLSRYADPDERRLQLLDSLSWSKGAHALKFGLEYNKVSDYDNNLYNGNGSYSYDYAYTFIADYLNFTTGIGGPVNSITAPCSALGNGHCYDQLYYSYSQEFGSPAGVITTREYAGYATDDWRITPNLTATLGVRYEYEYIPPNPYANLTNNPALAAAVALPASGTTALPITASKPDDRYAIGPRLGFAWNMFGDGKTILRGGYGIYYGRIVNANILQTYLESGSPTGQSSFAGQHPYSNPGSGAKYGCGPVWPNLDTTPANLYSCYASALGIETNSAAYLDPHMKLPEVHEADVALERNIGHNTTVALTYMLSLGRELPTAVDTNLNYGATVSLPYAITPAVTPGLHSYTVSPNSEPIYGTGATGYPTPSAVGGYTTYPHGGKTPPPPPANFQTKYFLAAGGRKNAAYYQILDVKSSVNSSYNAVAVQIDHRYEHGLSFMANYTFSKALDGNPYESTVVPGYTTLDPTNPLADYGPSATDVRQRFVAAIVYQPQTNFHGILDEVLGGWRIAPLLQMQTGLPYSVGITTGSFTAVTGDASLAGSGVNGAGTSAGRAPWIGRDSENYPKTAVLDFRLGKNFLIDNKIPHFERVRFELFAEVFNVMNHQNITGVTTEAFTLNSAKGTNYAPTLSAYPLFGTYTNSNSNFTYSPRQIQIAGRLHF